MQNIIQIAADKGLSQLIYIMSAAIGAVVMMVFSLWYSRKIGIKPYKAVVSISIASCVVLLLMEFCVFIATFFAKNHLFGIDSVYNSMSRVFVYVPLIAVPLSKGLKVEWVKLCDLFSFTQPFIWGTTSVGCIFAGCCRGYVCSWGVYNTRLNELRFPTQLVNAMILIAITVVLLLRAKKNNYIVDGKSYALMLALVGSTRFITEFIMDNEKIFFGCSVVSLHSLSMCVVGIVMLKKLKDRHVVSETKEALPCAE